MSRNKENFGPGSFSDQYDNNRMKSMDRDQNPGGVTGVPFEDDDKFESKSDRGEAWHYPGKRQEPERDADLGMGPSGTSWNAELKEQRNFSGVGPKGWQLSDEKLCEKVCEVLTHSYEVDPTEMEVTVEDSVVYLKGFIKSRGMKAVAVDLVYSIPGVEDVFTQLQVKDTSNFQLSPEALKEARDTSAS